MSKKRDLTSFPRLAYRDDDGTQLQYLGEEGLKLVNKLIELYNCYDGKNVDEQGNEITPEVIKAQNNLDFMPTLIKANLTAWFIDRRAAFMFERPIGLACQARQEDSQEEVSKPEYQPSDRQKAANAEAAAREKLLYQVMKQNLMHEKLLRGAKDHFIGGSVCAKLHYNENLGLRVVWRPRIEFWPIYNPDDVDVLEKIHFTAFVDDDTIWKQSYYMKDGICWMEEGLWDTQLKLKEWIEEPKSMDLPFLPMEILPNGGLTGETEGRSEVEKLKDLNNEIERKLSDNADSLRFGMFAIKVLLNAALPNEEEIKEAAREGRDIRLQATPNALWDLQSSDGEIAADVKALEGEFKYKDALKEHLETLLKLMHQLAMVPSISPEQIKGMGQLSGFAIILLYGIIISATNQSMITWKPRLQRLFGKALYMLNKYDTKKHYNQEEINAANLGSIQLSELDDLVEVKTTMPIPENEAELVDLEIKKVSSMIQSIKGAMDALGIENPEQKLAEILSEKKQVNEALMDQFEKAFVDKYGDKEDKGKAGAGGKDGNGGDGEEE